MAEDAFQPTESQVVMAKELARLQQELQAVQNTLAAGWDVLYGSENISIPHLPEISAGDKDETFIPSPTILPDLKDIPSSLTTKAAVCCLNSSLAHAPGVSYKHSTQHDIKSHLPDKVGLTSPHSSFCSALHKDFLSVDKVIRLSL